MLFSFRSFLNNFTLDNSNHVSSAWQVKKKNNNKKSELLAVRNIEPCILLILCLFCKFSSNTFSNSINQALLLNTFFFQKNFMNISCVHDTFMKYISGTRSIANVLTATKSNRNLSNMWRSTLRSLRRSFAPLQKPSSILRYVNIHSEIC